MILTGFAFAADKNHGAAPVAKSNACGIGMLCGNLDYAYTFQCDASKQNVIVTLNKVDASLQEIVSKKDSHYRVVPKGAFLDFIKGQLTQPHIQALTSITKGDMDASKHRGDLGKAQGCVAKQTEAVKNLEVVQGELQAAGIDTEKLKPISEALTKARSDLSSMKQDQVLCEAKVSATKKIQSEVDAIFDDMCSKPLSWLVSKERSPLLYSILSEFDPGALACGSSGSIEDRIKDCGELTGMVTGPAFPLVSRSIAENGRVSEFHIDNSSGLIWGPESPKKLSWQDAKKYCEGLSDLGLKWRLPKRFEFLKAANKDNVDQDYGYNINLIFAMGMSMYDKWFWSASEFGQDVWAFDGTNARVNSYSSKASASVRCVGEKKSSK